MFQKILLAFVESIQLSANILSNFFNNYILSRIDRYGIHNDLGASFTSILRNKNTITKKANNEGEEKLKDEINWYLQFKNSRIKKWLPKILKYSLKKNNVFYKMKYYNYPNLRKIIMYNGNAFFVLKLRWKKIFKIYTKFLFIEKNSSTPDKNFFHNCHLEKLKSRIDLIEKKAPYFKTLLKTKKITINDKVYLNFYLIINEITKSDSILTKLTPKKIYLSHGDLHSNNILCGIFPNNMILLDCRGKSPDNKKYFDPAYDIAKIFHDLRSYYSLIEKQMYSLFFFQENKGIKKEIKINYSFHEKEYQQRFFKNYQYVQELITEKMSSFEGLQYRADFIEAILYLTMVPMHLKIKSEGILCWATGIQRLNQWYERYHKKEYKHLLKKIKNA